MKLIAVILLSLLLQACVKNYEMQASENTTKLIVDDIYLPSYKSYLLNTMDTVVSIQSGKPKCPYDGGFVKRNHLGDLRLTKSSSSKSINVNKDEPLYLSYTITETILNVTSTCKASVRLDVKNGKEYKFSINSKECTAAIYESVVGQEKYVRSDSGQGGKFMDERLCIK